MVPNFPRLLWYLATGLRRLRWGSRTLQNYQEKRLRSIVSHAYHFVPFYHEKLKKAGISPADIRTLKDLSRLPVISKDEIRHENPLRLVSGELSIEKLKVVKTSGSTGQPFHVYLNGAEDDWRKAIYMRANISCGQRPRDRWVVVTIPRHALYTTPIQRKLGLFAQTCVNLYLDISEQVKLVRKAKPDVLDGYSNWLFLLAKEARKENMETIRPRMIFGSAEFIDKRSSRFIERSFNAPFYDQFGCSEVDRTAWQCPEKIGYHMDVDSVITQFVDSEGNDVSCDESGEIVYTSLFNYSMPLIRYAVGDIGVCSSEKCSCGRVLPLMKIVEGRKDSLLRLPDGRLLSPVTMISAINEFELFDQIEEYRLVQKRIDLFNIYIKKKDDKVDENLLRRKLVAHIMQTFGANSTDVNVEVDFLREIPIIKNGKHAAILSEIL